MTTMTTEVRWYESERERRLARDFDRLRARLLNVIELSHLPPVRERAARALIKDLTYESQSALIESLREDI